MEWMVRAAEAAGLEAVGLTDHCILPDRDRIRTHRSIAGYNLDLTYERRREAIAGLRERYDIEIYDAVEMDYLPGSMEQIERFLEGASFDYVIGSVHVLDGENVHNVEAFASRSDAARRAVVDTYFDRLERVIESGLFDIAAHIDIIERNEALRGIATADDYHRIAEALAGSETITEINAGRIDAEYGHFHPTERFLDVLDTYDVPITLGSDAHAPEHLDSRIPQLESAFERREIRPADPFEA